MSSAEFEAAIPSFDRPQTYASDLQSHQDRQCASRERIIRITCSGMLLRVDGEIPRQLPKFRRGMLLPFSGLVLLLDFYTVVIVADHF